MLKLRHLHGLPTLLILLLISLLFAQQSVSADNRRMVRVNTNRPHIVQRQVGRPSFRPVVRRPSFSVARQRVPMRHAPQIVRRTPFHSPQISRLPTRQPRIGSVPFDRHIPSTKAAAFPHPRLLGGNGAIPRLGPGIRPSTIGHLPRPNSLGAGVRLGTNTLGHPSALGTKRFDIGNLPRPNSIGGASSHPADGAKPFNIANLPRPNSLGHNNALPQKIGLGMPHGPAADRLTHAHFLLHHQGGNGVGAATQNVNTAKQALSNAQGTLFDAKTKLSDAEKAAAADKVKKTSAAAGVLVANGKLNDANTKLTSATQDLGAKQRAAAQAVAAQQAAAAKLAAATANPFNPQAIVQAQTALQAANAKVASAAGAEAQAQKAVDAAKQNTAAAQTNLNTAQKALGAAERAVNNAEASVAGDKKAVAAAQQQVVANHTTVSAAEQTLADKQKLAAQQREINQLENQQATDGASAGQNGDQGSQSGQSGQSGNEQQAAQSSDTNVATAPTNVSTTVDTRPAATASSANATALTTSAPALAAPAPVVATTNPAITNTEPAPAQAQGPAPGSVDVVAVIFQKDLSASDMATFLQAYQLTIVEGPDAEGIYKLRLHDPLPADQLQQLIESVKSQTAVVVDAGVQ